MAGRTVSVWRCAFTAPAAAAAGDSTQYLSFGIRFDETPDGVLRGALVLTTVVRVVLTVVLAVLAAYCSGR